MMNNQSELNVERPGSFIGHSMAEICGAYLELSSSQTHVLCGACVRAWKYLMQSSHFKSRVSTTIKNRVSTASKGRVTAAIESSVSLNFG